MPRTAGDYERPPDLFDPAVNVRIGVIRLRRLVADRGVVGSLAAPGAGGRCPAAGSA